MASFTVPSGSNVTATGDRPDTLNTSEYSACLTGPARRRRWCWSRGRTRTRSAASTASRRRCATPAGNPVARGERALRGHRRAHRSRGRRRPTPAARRASATRARKRAGTRSAPSPTRTATQAEDAGEPADSASKTWTSVVRGKVVGKGSFQSNVGGAQLRGRRDPSRRFVQGPGERKAQLRRDHGRGLHARRQHGLVPWGREVERRGRLHLRGELRRQRLPRDGTTRSTSSSATRPVPSCSRAAGGRRSRPGTSRFRTEATARWRGGREPAPAREATPFERATASAGSPGRPSTSPGPASAT